MALSGLLLVGFSHSASAQLRVSESVINMEATQTQQTVALTNEGNAPLTVRLELQEVIEHSTTAYEDEKTAAVEPEVLRVEPAEITIGALETGSFVLHHAPRELSTDAVYRVMVTPSFTEPQNTNILLNYHLLLFVRPKYATAKVGMKRRNNQLAMINYGNSNVRLTALTVCDESIDVCHSLPDRRLYSKQHWPVKLPAAFNVDHTTVYTAQQFVKKRRTMRYRSPTVTVTASQ